MKTMSNPYTMLHGRLSVAQFLVLHAQCNVTEGPPSLCTMPSWGPPHTQPGPYMDQFFDAGSESGFRLHGFQSSTFSSHGFLGPQIPHNLRQSMIPSGSPGRHGV
jgi:hypothetical protein